MTSGGKVWDVQTGQELLAIKDSWDLTFIMAGKRLVGGSIRNTVKVWDAENGQELLIFKCMDGAAAFSQDGKRIASAQGKTVKVCDSQKDQEGLILPGTRAISFSPDNQRLAGATSSIENIVYVWDAKSGQPIHILKGHTSPIHSVTFSPNGKLLASGGGGHNEPDGGWGTGPGDRAEVKVWDALTGQELHTLQGLTGLFALTTGLAI